MFIIVEGTDYAGKTTLIKAIVDEIYRVKPHATVLPTLHRSRPEEETRLQVLHDYVFSVEHYSPSSGEILVADRWHWGEATYAPLKRPHTNTDGFGLLGVAGWRWVELFLLSRGARAFWMKQPLDVLLSRAHRGDDYVHDSELGEILELYERTSTHAPTLALTLSPGPRDDLSHAAQTILTEATWATSQAQRLAQFPTYVGQPNPAVLLVGDQRNAGPHGKYADMTKLPFVPVSGNSSEFLLKALPASLWRSVGIVNGNEPGVNLPALLAALSCPPVVTLGRRAEHAARASGIAVAAALPHPQYVRRFAPSRQKEYGEMIAGVVAGETVKPWTS